MAIATLTDRFSEAFTIAMIPVRNASGRVGQVATSLANSGWRSVVCESLDSVGNSVKQTRVAPRNERGYNDCMKIKFFLALTLSIASLVRADTISVSAAISLKDVMGDITAEYQKETGDK